MIQEAEAYMEERRLLMAANGRFIRKINQAFFAFHGSYATSAASISPIDEQLKELQSRSDSLEEFVKTVATFASHQAFLEHLEAGPGATSLTGPTEEGDFRGIGSCLKRDQRWRYTQGVRLERSFSEA